jgi:hypothetical protein
VGHPSLDLIRQVANGEAGDKNERMYVPKELKDWINMPDEMLWVVNNTVIENNTGIATSHNTGTSEFGQTRRLANVNVMNNLFIHNGESERAQGGKSVDLRFWMHADKTGKRLPGKNCHSDYNVFAAGTKPMLKPNYQYSWAKNRTLEEWQKLYKEDLHSRIVPLEYTYSRRGFRLQSSKGLNCGTRLPEAVRKIWKPETSEQVGSNLTMWPENMKVFKNNK